MSDCIAITGMACRFPGAPDLDAFWRVLFEGRDTISRGLNLQSCTHDAAMFALDAFGVLDDIDEFDHRRFGVTPREAAVLDPQHRLWLQTSWHALEDAGLGDRPDLVMGVLAGCNKSAYLENNLRQDPDLAKRLRSDSSSETRQILNGNDKEFLPLRTSYALDLNGPSVNVQSACSTALVAVATACRTLISHEADVCIAGGASIVRTTDDPLFVESNAIHSASGYCRPFDANADGTVFGDGVGAVILRRLDDALADGDRVYATINGWGISNDGAAKSSFAAPSATAQATAIRLAHRMAGFPPETVSYVEAHGTGTAVGDPIEFEGLRRALGKGTQKCGVGSAKSNVGHLDTAAGIAALIKVCLMLQRRSYVPTVGFETANPLLNLERSRFRIDSAPRPWTDSECPRRAGVTALGVGGTNCHLALEEAPAQEIVTQPDSPASPSLLLMSATTASALERYVAEHSRALAKSTAAMKDYCRAVAIGRRHSKYRIAVVGDDAASFRTALSSPDVVPAKPVATRQRLVFAFTGQLVSYAGMTRGLFDSEPTFRRQLLACEEILTPHLGRRLTDLLFSDESDLALTQYEQPALCAVQIALADAWREWGLEPDAVLGYSLGEYAAAYTAGAIGLDDVLRLVAERGRLMADISGQGIMVSVLSPAENLTPILRDGCEIAAFPSTSSCVISAGFSDCAKLLERLEENGYTYRVLSQRYAFHSRWVDTCLPGLEAAAQVPRWNKPACAFISTQTGEIERERICDPNYWVEHARRPIRFDKAVKGAVANGYDLFLEIGPGTTLTDIARQSDATPMRWLPSLDAGHADVLALKRCIGHLYEAGVDIDWRAYFSKHPGAWVATPGYPFARKSFWIGSPLKIRQTANDPTLDIETTWTAQDPPYLQDHKLFGRVVVPASSHVSWVLEAIRSHWETDAFVVEDWIFLQPVLIPEAEEVRVGLSVAPDLEDENQSRFSIQASLNAAPGETPVPFLSATLVFDGDFVLKDLAVDTERLNKDMRNVLGGASFYKNVWMQGNDTGPAFRRIEKVWHDDDEAIARIRQDPVKNSGSISSSMIEAGFQTLYAATAIETRTDLIDLRRTWVPYTIERIRYRRMPETVIGWSQALHDPRRRNKDCVVGAISLYTPDGTATFEATGFQLRPLASQTLDNAKLSKDVYRIFLEPMDTGASVDAECGFDLLASAGESTTHTELARQLGEVAENLIILDATSDDFAAECLATLRTIRRPNVALRILFVHHAAPGRRVTCSDATSGCEGLLRLVAALDQLAAPVDRFIVSTLCIEEQAQVASSATESFARVLMNERPGWNIQLVCHDIDSGVDRRAHDLLAETVLMDCGEQIVHQAGRRYRRSLQSLSLHDDPIQFRGDRSYLVIGADNDQSHALANWLLDGGAGHVRLAVAANAAGSHDSARSRREQPIDIAPFDSDNPSVEAWLKAEPVAPSLAGIFFVPWKMDDGFVEHQSLKRFGAATQPIVDSLLELAERSEDLELEHFVCFSSSAALLGTQGQSSYAALTSISDALCAARRQNGMAAAAVNWPPWADVGHWLRNEAGRQATLSQGWQPLPTTDAFALLGRVLASDESQVGVLPVAWHTLNEYNGNRGMALIRRMISAQAPTPTASSHGSGSAVDVLSELVGEDVAGLPSSSLLGDVGLDSLMAVRLRNTLRGTFHVDIPLGELLGKTTVADLAAIDTSASRPRLSASSRPLGQAAVENLSFGTGGTPLFCFQWVTDYRNLAQVLGSTHSLYTIWFEDERDYATLTEANVEQVAARYVERLRMTQSKGPYRLLGWSFAGLIAYEVAQQLRQSGEKVSLLAMIDTNAPQVILAKRGVIRNTSRVLRRRGIRYVVSKAVARTRSRIRPVSSPNKDFRATAIARYKPLPYSGPVLLCVSEVNSFRYDRPADLGWTRYVSGGLTIHSLPGDHTDCTTSEGAKGLAEILESYLQLAH